VTSHDFGGTAKRLLGIYLLVQACLHIASILQIWGIVMPEGSRNSGIIAGAVVQGLILGVVGAVLVRSRSSTAGTAVSVPVARFHQEAVQLLGLFFLVGGLTSLASPLVGAFLVEAEWGFRAGQIAAAAIELAAGALLVVYPGKVTDRLDDWRARTGGAS